MLTFSYKDIQKLTDSGAFKRGEQYFKQGRVLACTLQKDRLLALVQGQGGDYRVQLWRTAHGLVGHCSCYITIGCKHAVAVALHYLDELNTPDWQRWLDKLPELPTPHKKGSAPTELASSCYHLLYQLKLDEQGVALDFSRAYLRKDGAWTQHKNFVPQIPYRSYMQPDFVTSRDLEILSSLHESWHRFSFQGSKGYTALQLALQEQRLVFNNQPAQLSPPRTLSWEWQEQPQGKQLCAQLDSTANWYLLATEPPCFLDDDAQIGPIDSPLNSQQIEHLLKAPPMPAEALPKAAQQFLLHFGEQDVSPPLELNCSHLDQCIPHLHVHSIDYGDGLFIPALTLSFKYGPFDLQAEYFTDPDEQSFKRHNGESFIIERDLDEEIDCIEELENIGFELNPLEDHQSLWIIPADNANQLIKDWKLVLDEILPELAEQDWHISFAENFNFQVQKADFAFSLGDATGGWFNLSLDVGIANGEALDTGEIVQIWLEEETPEQLFLPHNQGWLEVDTRPLQQIHSLLKGLILDQDFNQPLKLPLFQAAQLHELAELDQRAAPITSRLISQLNDFRGIETVKPPKDLQAELREYQQQGLNWLHFLHRHQFGGILADDMGLGKTLQVLSFIASLKEQQQLQQPALVVTPTSLLGNWQREAARFTPQLRTLILHGTQRTLDEALLAQADIILTSYTLLHLDGEFHQQQEYALAVLDEAQAIKNPHTKTAISARKLNTGMRLCLSGTPLENHLGELWSLMDFALPGLLYGQNTFNSTLRTPIERHGDAQASQELARKIAPFVLRRSKQQVAAELPEKTLITQYVELGSKQAALYESVRLSMEKHIRELIDKKGLAKSHIEFLDALLKLRQTCIAPQLVKLAQAKDIHESAKLSWLADNLPAMLEEGRRVLIFSQFTQALGLVEEVLKKQDIGYSKLTGATRKRQEAIDAFQLGDKPVFLISLKAGGSGLNLTRADTVIHLDPWWNPAVENQATDRAHRIGQDKPVFVYKLVASGTVEERIQQMQEQKQALADALFDSTSSAPKPENKDELLNLLAY